MKLIYPACFYPSEEGGFTVVFPDLPGCVTEGDTLAEAMEMAIDAASGWLLDEVEENKQLPKVSDIKNIIPDEYENGFVSLIGIDLDEYSQKHGNKAVKKTLTIPAWLNTIAEENNVNFSQVLQNALKDQLNIADN
ncbi:type II toxin-antitoxin system HicB family antitoxin [Desulfosporosinus sp. PR]|uniref:type II toxin-antitoxin system HicB family antitoxin n=1 Tax=Candidatus Desulfosporosinus nitrosoreducens TaxID=3401928 RepID=UPI0027EBA82A|nr:type II toxin-antitoxin system HicB family antitoxin [Desulfosporosinus sp. PR]MDQ7095960.1 type II toxin-antitoxin system HicB family antitoxin [Desulfosporosinus sp. PR]